MARRWEVFSDWEGGGFFAGGSFDAADRFDALNMQRYRNGSIGPRPQWRKATQTAEASSSVPSASAANKHRLAFGAAWSSWAPSGWTQGAIIYPAGGAAGLNRRLKIGSDGSIEFWAAAEIGQASAIDLKLSQEAVGINAVQQLTDGSNPVYIGGALRYDPSANSVATLAARTVDGALVIPNKLVIYRNRMYGWQAIQATREEYIVFSKTDDFSNFSDATLAGHFALSRAPSSFSPAKPRGLWALNSGLLIFASEGQTRSTSGYPGVTTDYSDFGRWYILSGPNVDQGSLTALEYNFGPIFHSLSVVHEGRVMFPIHRRGWALHDGDALDSDIMSSLRPGRGQDITDLYWLNPVKTHHEKGLILPFKVEDTDPTASGSGTTDRLGEFYNHGYGAYEWVNGAWTESLYLHGQGHLPTYGHLAHDKLFAIHLDSSDGGTNFYPQVYTRDVTLNRPSTSTDVFSSANETAPAVTDSDGLTGTGGATGAMVRQVTTGERRSGQGSQLHLEQIVVEYDFWNSSAFEDGAGFDIEVVYRSARGGEKQTQRITNRITPGSTSVGLVPKRDRFSSNIERITCGTFQVRITNIVGVAIHEIAVAVEEGDAFI